MIKPGTKRYLIIPALFLMILFNHAGISFAQSEDTKLTIQMDVRKEVKEFKDNKWLVKYDPVETVKQGDILVYSITYTNTGKTAATDAVIIDPIPKEAVYVLESATGKDTEISYSINDGKSYQSPPVKYVVRKPDGSEETKTAPPEMYTHIKWKIMKSLSPGQSGLLQFKVFVK